VYRTVLTPKLWTFCHSFRFFITPQSQVVYDCRYQHWNNKNKNSFNWYAAPRGFSATVEIVVTKGIMSTYTFVLCLASENSLKCCGLSAIPCCTFRQCWCLLQWWQLMDYRRWHQYCCCCGWQFITHHLHEVSDTAWLFLR